MKMGKGEVKEWLLWLAGRLIDERISFAMDALSDGEQWSVGVQDERQSRRIGELIGQWKAEHEMRS